jgi:predicted alpha-1,2-mannosidase
MWDISHYSKSSSSSEDNPLSYNPEYFEKGFMTAKNAESSVSNTIELGYNDWCVQQLALRLGEKDKAGQLEFRINGFKNLWNEKEKQFWPKDYNNEWLKNVKIDDWETLKPHYISGNIWAYKFGVLHNVEGMIELMGGKQKFEESLDELFTREIEMSGEAYVDISGFIGLYGHGDEPGHHIPYLYNYTSSPWKTQRIVNRIRNEFYHAEPDGYVNNEDCGQMSAWYVFSALGFYPVCPGKTTYEIGSPLFEYAIIELENGKQFKVIAHNVSDNNVYVKSVKLNGNPITNWQIKHLDIMEGGTLEFEMYDRINDDGKTDGSL